MNIITTSRRRGSALMVVLLTCTVFFLVAGALIQSTITETKVSLRHEMRSENIQAAEYGIDHAFAQYVYAIANNKGIYGDARLPNKEIVIPARGMANITSSKVDALVVRGAWVGAPIRRFVDPKDPSNATDPMLNRFVIENTVNLYAKAYSENGTGGEKSEVYIRKTMAMRDAPLFSHAVFYNSELLFHRNFNIFGDVHTNGLLEVSTHNGDAPLKFNGTLSSVGKLYRLTTVDSSNMGNRYSNGDDRTVDDYTLDLSAITSNSVGLVYAKNGVEIAKDFDTTAADWYSKSKSLYEGSVMDQSYGVPVYKPIGTETATSDNYNTPSVNEYNNSGYSLIEPLLPATHVAAKSDEANKEKMAAKAGLLLRVESNADYVPKDKNGKTVGATSSKVVNDNQAYVVKGYKYTTRIEEGTPVLQAVPLPDQLIGAANSNISSVQSGTYYPERYAENSSGDVTQGLEDGRTGRSMDLVTIDVNRLKTVIEGTYSSLDSTAKTFRDNFNPDTDWTGVVYVEFPTSLNADLSATTNTVGPVNSKPFQYGTPATAIPDFPVGSTAPATPPARTDKIVPIAEAFRSLDSTKRGLGLQVINGGLGKLPSKGATAGFTLATNTSMYLVGNYNADGNLSTGTGMADTTPTYAQKDSSAEVPAALMADSVTLLSNQWAANRAKSNQNLSGNASLRQPTAPLEVSAAIATADYAAYEFFVRSLEDWQPLLSNSKVTLGKGLQNPIVVKGALVSFYDGEIPLMKNVYSRDTKMPVDKYWNSFAAYAFTTPRFPQMFYDGNFPPGTPSARLYSMRGFKLLYTNRAADKAELVSAGFSL